MKKKMLALTLVGSFAFGGVAAASAEYYLDVFKGHKEAVKQTVDSEFESRFAEVDKQIYNDTISLVGTESARLEKESLEYLDQKLIDYRNSRMNSNANEITQETERSIEEMKTHIDSLFE
jgi:Fe-S cluster assembly iron-binding protein IscA